MRAFTLILAATLLLAGCLGAGPGDDDGAPADPAAPEPLPPQVVVAVIDSGINPYHVHFQRDGGIPDAILDGLRDADSGEAPTRVQLSSQGGYDERRDADDNFWDSVEAGRLYYFEGTRVLGITFGGSIVNSAGHGTGTAGAVLDANPDAIILFVQGLGSGQSEMWAAQQPWVDFMSESYGPLGSPPLWLVAGSTTAAANQVKWQQGGVPVGAADNTPALAPIDSTAGPPWVVGVAGDHPDGCRDHRSATFPDFTGHFTQNLPRDRSIDGYGAMSGTSFSTPQVAGSMSRVVFEVRTAWGHEGGITDGALAVGPDGQRLTNAGLRDAFNRTATYPGFLDCQGATPVNPVAPWLQMGWGHAGPMVVNATVAHLLGIEEAPPKDPNAVAFMEALYTVRHSTWGAAPV